MPDTDSPRLVVVPFKHGPFWNFSYLLGCAETGEAAVIDPAWDVGAMLATAERRELRISTVILTHAHHDHAHGVEEVVARTGARVIAHEAETADLRRLYGGSITAMEDTAEERVGEATLRMVHTPGHSAGSICIRAEDQLFTGDTIHVGALGRPGPDGGAVEALWEVVRSVLQPMPGELLIRPGHDAGRHPAATLEDERRANRALTARTFEEFRDELARSSHRILYGTQPGP